MNKNLHNVADLERIKELEAEKNQLRFENAGLVSQLGELRGRLLNSYAPGARSTINEALRQYRERAEKAEAERQEARFMAKELADRLTAKEAEVERLKAELDCHCLFLPHIEGCPMQRYERGGRESKEPDAP